MSEKLPAISGNTLIRFLESLDYIVVRQRGSHVRLVKQTLAGSHKLTVPIHDPVAKGTLADILSKVSIWCQLEKQELVKKLRSQ